MKIHYLVVLLLQSKTHINNKTKNKIRSFTALLTLILRDEGKLNLDDKLRKYFPGIKNE